MRALLVVMIMFIILATFTEVLQTCLVTTNQVLAVVNGITAGHYNGK